MARNPHALFTFCISLVAQATASSCLDETCLASDEASSLTKEISKDQFVNDLVDDLVLKQDAENAMTLLQGQTRLQNKSGVISIPHELHGNSSELLQKWALSLLSVDNRMAGILTVTTTVGVFGLGLITILAGAALWYAYSFPSGESLASHLPKNSEAKAEGEKKQSYIDGPSNSYEAPVWLNRLCLLGTALLMINYTVVMPASAEVSSNHGGSLVLSGLIIGIYSIGSALSVPFMYYLSKTSYPWAFRVVGIAGTTGNLLYAFAARNDSIYLILIARFTCGLEGGAIVVFGSALQKCNGAALVPMFIGRMATFGSAGLILGPTISSASRSLFPGASPEIVPALTMGFWTTVYALLALFVCPTHAECMENYNRANVDTRLATNLETSRTAEASSKEFVGASYVALCLSVVFQISRFFQRVFWESTLLVILTEEYGYGSLAAGYLISLGLLPLLFLGLLARYYGRFGFYNFVFITEGMQLMGILLMIRAGQPSVVSFAILMIGSGLFNYANWVQSVAYSVVTKYFAVPGIGILSVDGRVAIMYGLTYVGYFCGPVISRYIVDVCVWQCLLPYGLFLMFAPMAIGHLMVTHVLEDHFKKL